MHVLSALGLDFLKFKYFLSVTETKMQIKKKPPDFFKDGNFSGVQRESAMSLINDLMRL